MTLARAAARCVGAVQCRRLGVRKPRDRRQHSAAGSKTAAFTKRCVACRLRTRSRRCVAFGPEASELPVFDVCKRVRCAREKARVRRESSQELEEERAPARRHCSTGSLSTSSVEVAVGPRAPASATALRARCREATVTPTELVRGRRFYAPQQLRGSRRACSTRRRKWAQVR